jgi:hypothetical protein
MRNLSFIRSLLFTLMLMCLSAASFAQVGIQVSFGPPALPVYEQPICPGDGYIWTPGYWAWDGNNYYWVDGNWVQSPEVGFLWTPGYWGWGGDAYLYHEGYWGPHVGYYGGINYGYGYGGRGYEGGRWENDHFYYNTSVNRINNESIHNTYNTRVENVSETRVSYNGGNGGVNARPTAEEETYSKEHHSGPVAAQNQHVEQARSNPASRAVTSKPAEHASPANEARPATNDAAHAGSNNHASEVQPHKYAAPSTGKPATDQKYQQQQDQLAAKQNQQHQKLQQQQVKEHQQAEKKNTPEPQKQQMEQQHAQQTQQLEQKHAAQQEKVQTHQQPHQNAPPPQQSHPQPQKP